MYPQYDFSPKITADDIKALEATQEFMLESKMIEYKITSTKLSLKGKFALFLHKKHQNLKPKCPQQKPRKRLFALYLL